MLNILQRMKERNISFEKNVSVPNTKNEEEGGSGAGLRTVAKNVEEMSKGAVIQYFLRDPDGYYIEMSAT